MTKWADLEAVAEAAETWSYSLIDCRLYGHPWRSQSVIHHTRAKYYTVMQRCTRCRCTRMQEVDNAGYPLGNWKIDYRPGYLLKGLGRVGQDGKAHLRLTSLLNLPVVEVDDDA